MLMSINQYIENYFEDGSKPTRHTIINWINRGELFSLRRGGRIYVDPERDPFDKKTESTNIKEPKKKRKNILVKKAQYL